MSDLHEMHFKENRPEDTVKKLMTTLDRLGTEVEEDWQEMSCAGTHALRLTFKGTAIGTNGKGVTEDFARASAYAEFFERYQNNMMSYAVDGTEVGFDFHFTPEEKVMTAREIAQMSHDNPFLELYFTQRGLGDASDEVRAESFRRTHRTEYMLYEKDDYYVVVPYYSVRSRRVVYMPMCLLRMYYGSNGMCAGNTAEECIVQGISEILERYVQRRLFVDTPHSLPDVPAEYIARFPYVYEMFQKMQELDGYVVTIKDCSFGGVYPVAALVILEKNTGHYGVKLGCHPDFGVAMERCITEAAQGQDITRYVNRSTLDFGNERVRDSLNIYNSYKTGLAQYPFQILASDPSAVFTAVKDVSDMSNREIMNEWVTHFIEEGHDVLLRNATYLGLPAYHVIIPGMSEMEYAGDVQFRAYNTRALASGLLMYPENITTANVRYIKAALEYFKNSILENAVGTYRARVVTADLPGEAFHAGSHYMLAMCAYMEGDLAGAAKEMRIVYSKGVSAGLDDDHLRYYLAAYHYLEGLRRIGDSEHVLTYLRQFFDDDLCDLVSDRLLDPQGVFVKHYSYTDDPHAFDQFKTYRANIKKLFEAQAHTPIDQADNARLFDPATLRAR